MAPDASTASVTGVSTAAATADADTSAAVKSFLTSAANEGQAALGEQGYVPVPSTVIAP